MSQLFREVKRFIYIVQTRRDVMWDMYSRRIDEAWSQFILFTHEYISHCNQFFGRYTQHNPSSAYHLADINFDHSETSSFEVFQNVYAEVFGEPLPDVWFDATTVSLHRRVFNDNAGKMTSETRSEIVRLVDSEAFVLLSINSVATEALTFIAAVPVFYVRELSTLNNDDKISLVSTLVEASILRVGS